MSKTETARKATSDEVSIEKLKRDEEANLKRDEIARLKQEEEKKLKFEEEKISDRVVEEDVMTHPRTDATKEKISKALKKSHARRRRASTLKTLSERVKVSELLATPLSRMADVQILALFEEVREELLLRKQSIIQTANVEMRSYFDLVKKARADGK